jgi:adenylyltransferase/sulfurtransferase
MNDEELLRYSRHILLSDIDVAGQEKLAAAQVLIIGAGGLGCPAAIYLAASGVGHLVIADDDVVEMSNLQRQIGHDVNHIGSPKVHSLAERLKAINPLVRVTELNERLEGTLLQTAMSSMDVVLDCSDNFLTRQNINRVSLLLKKPLVSGAAIRFEGQLSVFNCTDNSPCYACLYGNENNDEMLTCSESGVFSPVVGVVGSLMAAETLKLIIGVGVVLDGRLLLCDMRDMDWRSLDLHKDPLCPVCAN